MKSGLSWTRPTCSKRPCSGWLEHADPPHGTLNISEATWSCENRLDQTDMPHDTLHESHTMLT